MSGKHSLARRLTLGLVAAVAAGAAVVTPTSSTYANAGTIVSPSGASVALVTQTVNGKPSGLAQASSLSGNGRYVAFRATPVAPLVKGVTTPPYCTQVYWRDMQKGITRVASAATDGSMDNTSCAYSDQAISGNGRYVAFTRPDATMKPALHTGSWLLHYVFIKDMKTGKLTSYSLPAEPTIEGHSPGPWTIISNGYYMSYSGQQIVLTRDYDGLGGESTYVLDQKTGTWTTVCRYALRCQPASMSADGRYVSLYYQPLNQNAAVNALWDRTTDNIRTFPTPNTGGYGPDTGVISPNGKVFVSSFNSWTPSGHERVDIFDLGTGKRIQTIENLSYVTSVVAASWDGRYLLSPAVDKRISTWGQALRFDRLTMSVHNASVSPTGKPADYNTWPNGMSYDGNRILFASMAGNLVPGDREPTSNDDRAAWDDFVGTFH